MNPRDARTALYLGLAKESLGQTEEALKAYREAIHAGEVSGQLDIDMLLSCARLLLRLANFEESRQWIDRALRLAPKSRDALRIGPPATEDGGCGGSRETR